MYEHECSPIYPHKAVRRNVRADDPVRNDRVCQGIKIAAGGRPQRCGHCYAADSGRSL
ncbi:MAG TPA: hypothetical protein GXX14_01840 [Clostridiaceae bacterium]|nr:hypothetical protein [Clostridiaceae bacterium]